MNRRRIVSIILSLLMAVSFLPLDSEIVLAGETVQEETTQAKTAQAEAVQAETTQAEADAEHTIMEQATVPENTAGAGVDSNGEADEADDAAELKETTDAVPETEEAEKAEEAEEEEMLLRDPEPYLAVGGKPVTVTGTGIVDVFGDGKAVYDPNTKTLTLKNADYTSGTHASGAAVVSVSLDLTIKGSGKLTGSGYGIFVQNGSLTLDGADITAVATDHSGGDDAGIFADKNITIKNSTVKASAEDFGIYAKGGSVYIEKDITSVTADGSQAAILALGGTIKIDYSNLKLGIREPAGGKLSGDGKVIKKPDYSDATHASIVKYDLLPKMNGVRVNVTGTELKDGKYYAKLSKQEAVFSDSKVPVSYDASFLFTKQSCQTGDILTTAPVPGTPYYFPFVINAYEDGVDIPTLAWAENEVIKNGSSLTADKGTLELAKITHGPQGGGITLIFKYTEKPVPAKIPIISYRTHVQKDGWQAWKMNGEMSGTEGQSKRLEGINITLSNLPYPGGIDYRTHVQTYGWQGWKSDGEMAGTSGESKRLEAIQIRLAGEIANYYDVYYQTHIQKFGWSGWAKNGEMCGSAGYSYRLEGIRIKMVKKGEAAPGSTADTFHQKSGSSSSAVSKVSGALVGYNTHVQTFGWQDYVYDNGMSGTSGQSKRLEGIHIALVNKPYTGDIVYRTHVQKDGWQAWKKNGDMSGTSGESKRLEGIQIYLTGEMAKHYDVYYQVHAQTYGWLDYAKNGVMAGTSGLSKRLEGIRIVLVPKGGAAPGKTAKPYVVGGGGKLPDNPYTGT